MRWHTYCYNGMPKADAEKETALCQSNLSGLSARKVHTLTKPGSYSDGGGLELHIRETGAKSWALRVMVDGKRVMRGLGSYPTVGLADARALAVEYREALREGRDIGQSGRRRELHRRPSRRLRTLSRLRGTGSHGY